MQPTDKAIKLFKDAGWKDTELEAQGYMKDGKPLPAIIEALRANNWEDDFILDQGLATQDPGTDDTSQRADTKVQRYVELRDEITRMNNDLKAKQLPYKGEMEDLEQEFAELLDRIGQTTMKSDSGTFFFVDKNQIQNDNHELFMQWVVGTIIIRLVKEGFMPQETNSYQATDCAMESLGLQFLTQAVRKEAVVEYTKEHGTPPPGINYETVREVQVRRPTKKK